MQLGGIGCAQGDLSAPLLAARAGRGAYAAADGNQDRRRDDGECSVASQEIGEKVDQVREGSA